jgi:cytochrome c-type biogenesis protein
MIGGIEHLVDSGPLLLAMPVAVAAGAVTFLSPCCLPLVPGYLSYLTGMSGTAVQGQNEATAAAAAPGASRSSAPATTTASSQAAVATIQLSAAGSSAAGVSAGAGSADVAAATAASVPPGAAGAGGPTVAVRGRAVLGTLLFVLGFAAVFTAEGAALGSIGAALSDHIKILTQVLGFGIILLGLMFLGAFDRLTFTGRIFRPQYRPRAGLAGAPLLGAAFGLGWTPCIGPTLSAVLSLGLSTGAAGRGALLAFVYALGLGIPFLIVAFAFQRGVALFGFARRHARLVTQVGGVLLIAVGLLEVTGAWSTAVSWLQVHWLTSYTAPI